MRELRLVLYILASVLTLGKIKDTRLGARIAFPEVLEALEWMEDLEDEIVFIDADDHVHYRSKTEPRHVSFWKEDGEWKGGLYDNEDNLLSLIYTIADCPYLDRKRDEIMSRLAEGAEPWWNKVTYESEIPSMAQVMSREEFELVIEDDILTDADGFGLLVKDGKISEDYSIKPSNWPDVAKDATHVAWIQETD